MNASGLGGGSRCKPSITSNQCWIFPQNLEHQDCSDAGMEGDNFKYLLWAISFLWVPESQVISVLGNPLGCCLGFFVLWCVCLNVWSASGLCWDSSLSCWLTSEKGTSSCGQTMWMGMSGAQVPSARDMRAETDYVDEIHTQRGLNLEPSIWGQ